MPPYMAEDIEKAYLARVKDIRPDLGGDPQAVLRSANCLHAGQGICEVPRRPARLDRQADGRISWRSREPSKGSRSLAAQVETNALDWLQKSFGDFAELTESILGIRLNDSAHGEEFIEYLVSQRDKLLELRRLDLAGCAITDASVRQLSVFRRLQDLNLSRTPITWEALHIVQWLPELEECTSRNQPRVGSRVANWRPSFARNESGRHPAGGPSHDRAVGIKLLKPPSLEWRGITQRG